jgi:hypothetical protein
MSKILFHTPTGTTKPYPRSDNEPVVGLAAEYEVFDLIEPARPTFDPTTHEIRRLPEEIDTQAKMVTRGWEIAAMESEPVVVTMRSFREACGLDLVTEILTFISGIQEAKERFKAQNDFEFAPTVARNNPRVAYIAAQLGKTETETDEVFAAAKQLDAQ